MSGEDLLIGIFGGVGGGSMADPVPLAENRFFRLHLSTAILRARFVLRDLSRLGRLIG